MGFEDTECSICLQKFVHPSQLPCGHVFCFLCIKGSAFHRPRCPICRRQFSIRFFDDPKLVLIDAKQNTEVMSNDECSNPPTIPSTSSSSPNTGELCSSTPYSWFYEGFGGWWEYDERTSAELEDAFGNGCLSHEIVVAGHVYTIDFTAMSQRRKDRSGRKRRIKRDVASCEKKGIAGIRLNSIQGHVCENIGDTNAYSSTVPGVSSVSNSGGPLTQTTLTDHTYARPTTRIVPTQSCRHRSVSCSSNQTTPPSQGSQVVSNEPALPPPAATARNFSHRQSRNARQSNCNMQLDSSVPDCTSTSTSTTLRDSPVRVQQNVTTPLDHRCSTRSTSRL